MSSDPTPLDTLLNQCERIVQVHEHLRMDTDEDERVRRECVVITRRALGQCRDYVERVRALGPRPDRAAALQDVETLLRRVHDVTEEADDVVRFYLAGDGAFLRDQVNVTAADLAALIVDRVLGAEQDGGAAAT